MHFDIIFYLLYVFITFLFFIFNCHNSELGLSSVYVCVCMCVCVLTLWALNKQANKIALSALTLPLHLLTFALGSVPSVQAPLDAHWILSDRFQ